MSEQPGSGDRNGFWRRLWKVPRKRWALGIPAGAVVAVVLGMAIWQAFLSTLAATNTMEFCVSCHEMEAFVYEEYKQTVHYQNASGVRAECADCHVPKALVPKVLRKMQASLNELPGHFMGKIDTKENFEAHRAELAERVWARMRANDSQNCRSCHSYEAMDLEIQDRQAKRRHSQRYLEASGKTCIDCHDGIAHKLPDV